MISEPTTSKAFDRWLAEYAATSRLFYTEREAAIFARRNPGATVSYLNTCEGIAKDVTADLMEVEYL